MLNGHKEIVKNEPSKKDQQPKYKLMFKFGSDTKFKFGITPNLSSENINELFYIVPLDNLENILQNGLLSHRRIEKLKKQSNSPSKDISNHGVQDLRDKKIIERVDPKKKPRGIHRHVNMYQNPHNAMMSNLVYGNKDKSFKPIGSDNLCILVIHGDILKRKDIVITNENATVNCAQFFTVPSYKLDTIHTTFLTDKDFCGTTLNGQFIGNNKQDAQNKINQIQNMTGRNFNDLRRQSRQAEVLAPYKVDPSYIIGVFVKDEKVQKTVQAHVDKICKNGNIPVKINSELFLSQSMFSSLNNYQPIRDDNINREFNNKSPESDKSDDDYDESSVIKLIRSQPK